MPLSPCLLLVVSATLGNGVSIWQAIVQRQNLSSNAAKVLRLCVFSVGSGYQSGVAATTSSKVTG